MNNKHNPPTPTYFAEFGKTKDGKFKVVLAKKLTVVNQYKRSWQRINARELARVINTSDLVIK